MNEFNKYKCYFQVTITPSDLEFWNLDTLLIKVF